MIPFLPFLFIAKAGSPLLKLWCCKQSAASAVCAGKQNDSFHVPIFLILFIAEAGSPCSSCGAVNSLLLVLYLLGNSMMHFTLILFIAEAGSPLLKLWCCKQSVVCAVLAGKQNDAFSSLEKVGGVFLTHCMLGNYKCTSHKRCLWEGILFSRCPSDRPSDRV